MPITKQSAFTKKTTDLPDTPSPQMTATEIKTYIQTPSDELMTTLNNAIDKLNSTTDGNSGADNVGATGFDNTAKTVQVMLEDLNTRKTDKTGNHEGTWQGFTPSQVDQAINSRVDQLDTQLAETEQLLKEDFRITQSSPYNYSGAVAAFIDDDTGIHVPEIWGTIIANKNIKMGFAVPTAFIEGITPPHSPQLAPMPLSYLHQLYNDGHDVYSHSHTHPAFYDDVNTTLQKVDDECRLSKQWLLDNGFNRNADIIVYPGGLGQSKVTKKNIIRKYYKYGIDTFPNVNPKIVDNWCIYRPNADTSTLEQLKAKVDEAHADGRLIVFMCHAYEMYPDKVNQIAKIEALVDYIRSKGIPIMPFSEAVKYKGNAIALGEYTEKNNVFLNVQGKGLGLQVKDTGDWSPTLIGSSVSGTHTYTTRKGTYTIIGNMVTVSFNIRINYTDLDSAMAGSLRITGLPFTKSANEQGASSILDYNHLTMGTNYTHAIVSALGIDYLGILKQGNGVNSAFLTVADLTPNQTVVLSGQVSYRIA